MFKKLKENNKKGFTLVELICLWKQMPKKRPNAW